MLGDMYQSDTPKPGPHLHQPPTLAALAELHARQAHERLANDIASTYEDPDWRLRTAEAHAAVARACAHAALANRPHTHTPRVVKL